MTRQIRTNGVWDSTPIGRSMDLYLRREEPFSPQLILEEKVLRSVLRLREECPQYSQIQCIATLISDDESQRLIYVIDRLFSTDSNRHPMTSGEFLVPILFDSIGRNQSIEDGIKVESIL